MKYKTIFYEVTEDGRNLEEDYILELDEKIPDLDINTDISLPDNDYFVMDKFYDLQLNEEEDMWIFTTCYGVMDQEIWYEQLQKNSASPL